MAQLRTMVPGTGSALQARIFQGYNPASYTRDRNGILSGLAYSNAGPLNGGLAGLALIDDEQTDLFDNRPVAELARVGMAYGTPVVLAPANFLAETVHTVNPAGGLSDDAIESALSDFGMRAATRPIALNAVGGLGNTELNAKFPDAPQLFSAPGGGHGGSALQQIIYNINEEIQTIIIQHGGHHRDPHPGQCGPHNPPSHHHDHDHSHDHGHDGCGNYGHDHDHHHDHGQDGCGDHGHGGRQNGCRDHKHEGGGRSGSCDPLPPILICLVSDVLDLAMAIGTSAAAGLCLADSVLEQVTPLLSPCGITNLVGDVGQDAGTLIGHVEKLAAHELSPVLHLASGLVQTVGETLETAAQNLHLPALTLGLTGDAGLTLPTLSSLIPSVISHGEGLAAASVQVAASDAADSHGLAAGVAINPAGVGVDIGTHGITSGTMPAGLALTVRHGDGAPGLAPISLSLLDGGGASHNLVSIDLGGQGPIISLNGNSLTDVAADATHGVTNAVGAIVDGVTGTVTDTVHGITGVVGDAISSVTGTVTDAAHSVTNAGGDIVNGVTDTLTNTAHSVTSVTSDAVNGAAGTMAGVASQILPDSLSLNVDVGQGSGTTGTSVADASASVDASHSSVAAQVTVAAPSITDLTAALSTSLTGSGVSVDASADAGVTHTGTSWTSIVAPAVDTVSHTVVNITPDVHIVVPVHVHG